MIRGKMSTEEALTQAISAVESLDLPTGGDNGSTGSQGSQVGKRKKRNRTGGNVPESTTDDAFGEV